MTALALGCLAVLLAGPVPAVLARAPHLRLVPRATLVLWQAVAVATVLAGLTATLVVAGGPSVGGPQLARDPAIVLSVTAVVVVAGRLLWTGHVVGTRLRASRRRHRALLDLVGTHHLDTPGLEAAAPSDVHVVQHPAPTAYCLPALGRSRLVLTSGALATLNRAELGAVVAHERAHLVARHDLLLEAFTVLHRAFPRVGGSRAALSEVRLLVELLADQAAVRRVGARSVGRALVSLAGNPHPESALGAGGSSVLTRVALLGDRSPHRALAAATYAAAAAVLASPVVLLLPWR